MSAASPPVFYDKTGKRLRRVVLSTIALMCVIASLGTWLFFAAQSPLLTPSADPDFALKNVNDSLDQLPMIGTGVLTRMVSVTHDDSGIVQLSDTATGQHVRDATADEAAVLGDQEWAIERFGTPPDRTLMLTFDDGPDARWTPQLLDLLSREGVPATFFVLGEMTAKRPDIVDRIVREGHMVANHSMTHPDFFEKTGIEGQREIVLTDHLIRAAAGYSSPLFRIPTASPEVNFLAQLQSQHLGYLHTNFDLDSHDWQFRPDEQVPLPALDGQKGHVLLMHDAGGQTREPTVAMVEKLIAEAKAKGYVFTTMAPVIPEQFQPQHITPSFTDRMTLWTAQAWYVAPQKILKFVFWFGVGSMIVLTSLYLVLSVVNEWRQRRRKWPDTPENELPFVSVVLAAYNEDQVITRTLDALRGSDYPTSQFEVIATDDGSTDATLDVLRSYQWSALRVITQPNGGKASALNNGISQADSRASVIITLDADTLFRPDTIRLLARHFIPERRHRVPRVGAVAGHVKVGNRRNIWTAWQSLEYLNGICIIRMAEMMVGAVGIVPGACSAWRRDLLAQIGGFTEDTLAEDADAAMTLQQMRYQVLHENHAICDTEAPETMVPLLKQRKRWMFGNIQVMWKHRNMIGRPRYGVLGMVTLPYSLAQLLLNLLFLPALLVMATVTAVQGQWQPLVSFAAIVLVMHTVIAITAVLIAREKWWHLAVVPIYRPIYEVLRVYLLYACLYRVIKGAEFSWDKLERLNTVIAFQGGGTIEATTHAVAGCPDDERVRVLAGPTGIRQLDYAT